MGDQLDRGSVRCGPSCNGRRLRTGRLLLGLALAVMLAGLASPAQAATVSLAISPDPAEDRDTTFTISGVADVSGQVRIFIRPAGGAPCATTDEAEQGSPLLGEPVGAGAYTRSRLRTIADPGQYLLCGYLEESSAPDRLATVTFTVRSNIASLAIDPLPILLPKQPVVLTFRGATEIARRLYARIKPAGGAPCGTSWSTDTGDDLVSFVAIDGAYAVPLNRTFDNGGYLVCAWVQEASGDLSPEASTSLTISVEALLNATKLEVARARVLRASRTLDVLAPISALASGNLNAKFHAAGQISNFTVPIDSSGRRALFRRGLSPSQARKGTGILTLTYGGDADTQPQEVRLRAASRKANLAAGRPEINGGRLTATGRISQLARGVVRLQLIYKPAGAPAQTHEYTARIANGRYGFDVQLPPEVLAGIAARRGVVHSYTLFTGYLSRRMRGEMRSYQVIGPQ